MKHTEKLFNGFYFSNSGKAYRVAVDKYAGNNYRVIHAYDKGVDIVGKTLHRGHGFRLAKKAEYDLF